MYKIKITNFEKKYLLEELIKVFLPPDEYVMAEDDAPDDEDTIFIGDGNISDRNEINRQIYDKLSLLTGKRPAWGILTGIRPVKLCGELYEKLQSTEAVLRILTEDYYLSEEKARLIMDMYLHQKNTAGSAPRNSAGVYIGIPFCPTRCVYCSFASNQVPEEEIEKYLMALHREIRYTGRRMKETGLIPETVYIGGGTPTTLSAQQLDELIGIVLESFDFSAVREFTVEAGRPDTITEEKLSVMKHRGVDRISINPQSMKAETLETIGRSHQPEDIRRAFQMAREQGFDNINCDIIAGLPGEDRQDFADTLRQVMAMGPENITVHCLAVKRASRLIDIDRDFHYKQADRAEGMLETGRSLLAEAGYQPYYLYRQKHMAGAFENTGYCRKDKDCIYNIRIMDEHQSVVALGAGGISKVYYPAENRLERVANVTNYQEYIRRIEEMLDRKEKNIFMEVKKWQS
ncbi:MAG: coproporphyrinogen dehydrogenase HemZ [Emergencia sp.]